MVGVEENKELVRRYTREVFDEGKIDAVDSICTALRLFPEQRTPTAPPRPPTSARASPGGRTVSVWGSRLGLLSGWCRALRS
jgi:hypothetical protein